MEKAIIGGTGVYEIGKSSQQEIKTEYGRVIVDMVKINGEEIAFLARHGKGHSVPPHLINYRANMRALRDLGIKYIYATCAVGSCNESFVPSDVVVLKDFIDFTKVRPLTFYEGSKNGVAHVTMDAPYCPNLRETFFKCAQKTGLQIKGHAVYVSTEGPRFETAHEIKMYKMLGGDVVGMTNVPEVVLAKELGMCYQAVGIITNWCTGIKGDVIDHDIKGIMEKNKALVTETFILALNSEKLSQYACKCKASLLKL